MKSKEKAKELVDTFKPNAYRGACEENDELMELYHSKQCALKAVDEILKDREEIDGMRVINDPYWLEVKQEINNL